MSGRLPKAQRALVALLGTFVPIAPGMISGCGSNTPPATASAPDAGISWVSVITSGGGDGKTIPPAGPGAKPSSGDNAAGSSGAAASGTAGSSGTSESGAASGSGGAGSGLFFGSGSRSGSSGTSGSGHASGASSGSGAPLDGGNEGGSSGTASDAAPGVCDDYQITNCGSQPCDLRANTCCVTLSFATRCLPGQNAACASNEATLHCSNGCECGGDTVCCGVSNTIVGSIQSVCQSVPNGSTCKPYPDTTTMASAQFCKADSQCKNGQGCIHQTCMYMGITAVFDMCGLQPGCM